MKFDTPAGHNPIDRLTVVGQPLDRFEAPLKTTGTATYAYDITTWRRTSPMAMSSARHRQGPDCVDRHRGRRGRARRDGRRHPWERRAAGRR